MKKRIIAYLCDDGYTEPFDGENWKKGEKKTLTDDPDAFLLFQDPPQSIPDILGYERDIIHEWICYEGPFKVGF